MQQRKLNDYHQKNIAVVLENCEVKPAHQSEGYEEDFYTNPAISQEVGCHTVDGWHRNSIQNRNTSITQVFSIIQKVIVNMKVVELKDETQCECNGKTKVTASRISLYKSIREQNTSHVCDTDLLFLAFCPFQLPQSWPFRGTQCTLKNVMVSDVLTCSGNNLVGMRE